MAIYNLTVGTAKGKCALAKYEYNMREGLYSKGTKGEELIYKTNENMPSFAINNPRFFWKSADNYERSNSNQYRKIEFSLPHELSEKENIELANKYAKELLGNEFPYSLAIHKKRSQENSIDNIHCHIIFHERKLDGIERNEIEFFRKHNKKNPEKGGAKKEGNYWGKKQTLYSIRKSWEDSLNIELEKKYINKVSCKSLKKQREEAIAKGDYLTAELLDRPTINIDMIESNRIKKICLTDDDLIVKSNFFLAQEIKKIKENEYSKKSKNYVLENSKIFENYNMKNELLPFKNDFIEKDIVSLSNIEIFNISIEKQILKEQLYKKIALINEKIIENNTKKEILSSNNSNLNKIYAIEDKYTKYKESLMKDLNNLISTESYFIPKEISKRELNILKKEQKEKIDEFKIRLNKITLEIKRQNFTFNTASDKEKINYKNLKVEEKKLKEEFFLSINKLKKLNILDNQGNQITKNEFINSRLEKLKEKEDFHDFMSQIEKNIISTQKFDINSPEIKENFINFHKILTSNDEFSVSIDSIDIDDSFEKIKESELLKVYLDKTSLKEMLYSDLQNLTNKLEKNTKNINTKLITNNNYIKTKNNLNDLIHNSKNKDEIEYLKNKIELINKLSNKSTKKLKNNKDKDTIYTQEKSNLLNQIDSIEKNNVNFIFNYSEENKKVVLKQKNFLEIERSNLLKEKEIFIDHLKIIKNQLQNSKDPKANIVLKEQIGELIKYKNISEKKYFENILKSNELSKIKKDIDNNIKQQFSEEKSIETRLIEINTELEKLSASSNIENIQKSLYNKMTGGKYTETLEEINKVKEEIKTIKKIEAVTLKTDTKKFEELQNKLHQYQGKIERLHLKYDISPKISHIREPLIIKIEELKAEKQNIFNNLKIKKLNKKSNLDFKENRYHKGNLNTKNIFDDKERD